MGSIGRWKIRGPGSLFPSAIFSVPIYGSKGTGAPTFGFCPLFLSEGYDLRQQCVPGFYFVLFFPKVFFHSSTLELPEPVDHGLHYGHELM